LCGRTNDWRASLAPTPPMPSPLPLSQRARGSISDARFRHRHGASDRCRRLLQDQHASCSAKAERADARKSRMFESGPWLEDCTASATASRRMECSGLGDWKCKFARQLSDVGAPKAAFIKLAMPEPLPCGPDVGLHSAPEAATTARWAILAQHVSPRPVASMVSPKLVCRCLGSRQTAPVRANLCPRISFSQHLFLCRRGWERSIHLLRSVLIDGAAADDGVDDVLGSSARRRAAWSTTTPAALAAHVARCLGIERLALRPSGAQKPPCLGLIVPTGDNSRLAPPTNAASQLAVADVLTGQIPWPPANEEHAVSNAMLRPLKPEGERQADWRQTPTKCRPPRGRRFGFGSLESNHSVFRSSKCDENADLARLAASTAAARRPPRLPGQLQQESAAADRCAGRLAVGDAEKVGCRTRRSGPEIRPTRVHILARPPVGIGDRRIRRRSQRSGGNLGRSRRRRRRADAKRTRDRLTPPGKRHAMPPQLQWLGLASARVHRVGPGVSRSANTARCSGVMLFRRSASLVHVSRSQISTTETPRTRRKQGGNHG